jgi:hypothetical protein
MTIRSSILWQLQCNAVGKKLLETVVKCPPPSVVRFISNQSLCKSMHVKISLNSMKDKVGKYVLTTYINSCTYLLMCFVLLGDFNAKSYKWNFMWTFWNLVLVEFVLVETVLLRDPLYSVCLDRGIDQPGSINLEKGPPQDFIGCHGRWRLRSLIASSERYRQGHKSRVLSLQRCSSK